MKMRPAIPDLEIHEHGTFDIEILVGRSRSLKPTFMTPYTQGSGSCKPGILKLGSWSN